MGLVMTKKKLKYEPSRDEYDKILYLVSKQF